ncbi:hypothetical protein CDV36_015919 [Fusarium kuroshium]|uniref:Uncharacterized protein n=1 Tax=Fusarium kuroshium TaxID=2010991 RepID=A0A3M2R5J5_9HYPO|nr:hypothetical protein CDV36_015919 [Fusarium kuroshium]
MSGIPNTSNNESDNASSNYSNNELSISTVARAFAKRLEDYQRVPVSGDVWKSWVELQDARQDSTEKILANEGQFETWFAHYLIKHDTGVTRRNKQRSFQQTLLLKLENESVTWRREFAKTLATAISAEAREKATKVLKRLKDRNQPSSDSANNMSEHRDKRQRVVEPCDGALPNNLPSSAARQSGAASPARPTHVNPGPALTAPPPSKPRKDYFHQADLHTTSTFFQGELYNSIERDPVTGPHGSGYAAAISMEFTYEADTNTCIVALEIKPDMAVVFAREWFAVPVLIISGRRCLTFASGTSRVSSRTELELEGCLAAIIHSSFSDLMLQAIVANPIYFEETQKHSLSTECIWMEIPCDTSKRATIYVALNVMLGTVIKDRLFPQYRLATA